MSWKLDENKNGNSITIDRVPNGWGMRLRRVESSGKEGEINRVIEEDSLDPDLSTQLDRAQDFFIESEK